MTRVILSPFASFDQEEIIHYLDAEVGVRVAEKHDADFRSLYNNLSVFPCIGTWRPDLGKNIRIWVLRPISSFTNTLLARIL